MSQAAPYGSWRSPITASLIAAGEVPLAAPDIVAGDVYWLEGKPLEGGRVVLVKYAADETRQELTPSPYYVRTRVHEYGGGACVVRGPTVWFSNFGDQRLYRQDAGQDPRPITPEPSIPAGLRYADACLTHDGTLVICVRECHEAKGVEATNELVALPADGSSEARVIASGHDFFSSPRISPDGRQLAWLTWDHPRMPWDGTQLWLGDLAQNGSVSNECCLAGGPEESIFQPEWSAARELYFVSDRTGWWNLYRCRGDSVDALAPMDAEFGAPQWGFGMSTYAFLEDGRIAAIMSRGGIDQLVFVRPGEPIQTADLPYTAYAIYYPPANADYTGPPGDRPPLIVESHGGPTAMTLAQLSLEVQFWTSRGFGVVDVNYGGSSGFGRAYRERLKGNWGIVDTQDCISAARYLAEQGEVDGRRLAIRGGSAGGYTTLCALVFHDDFAAGASYYGVADCEALATDTHKFESRYLDGLIGPYPEARAVYVERSPIHLAERLSCPLILFQGLEDRVVPPAQAERMVEALRAKHLPVAYLAFAGEQHGFRQASTIQRTLEAELYFYSRVFAFRLADQVEPVPIENLAARP